MKSRNKKRLLALVLCMVVAISNSSFIFASETGQTEYPQEAEVQTQDEAVADDMDVAAYAADEGQAVADEQPAAVEQVAAEPETTAAAPAEQPVAEAPAAEQPTTEAPAAQASVAQEPAAAPTEEAAQTETVVEGEESQEEESEEQTPEENQEEEAYVQTLEYEDDNVKIHVSAKAEGIIPENASLKVVPLVKQDVTAGMTEEEVQSINEINAQYDVVEQKLNEKADEEEYDIGGFLAYDISFVDADGNKAEPNGDVKVTMEYKNAVLPETIEKENASDMDVTVMHLEEDAQGNVKQVVDMSQENNKIETIETTNTQEIKQAVFETNSFSPYAITWKNGITDVEGNKINENTYKQYLKEMEDKVEGTQDGNLPITDWTRSSRSVNADVDLTTGEQDVSQSKVNKEWWEKVSKLKMDLLEPDEVWDGSRKAHHYYEKYLPENKRSIYQEKLYDSATWIDNHDRTNPNNECVYRFQGTFDIGSGDPNYYSYTIQQVTGNKKLYINDDMWVFIYPKGTTLNATNFMDYLAFWTGTRNQNDSVKYFNTRLGTAATRDGKAESNNNLIKLTDGWNMVSVEDNAGAIIQSVYNQGNTDTRYVLDVFVGDNAEGGGTYRLTVNKQQREKTPVEIKKISTSGEALSGAEFVAEDDSHSVHHTAISGSDGIARLSLMNGTYTLKETKAPNGYVKRTDTWRITVNDGDYTITGLEKSDGKYTVSNASEKEEALKGLTSSKTVAVKDYNERTYTITLGASTTGQSAGEAAKGASVILVLDASSSMKDLQGIKTAAKSFVNTLKDASQESQVSVSWYRGSEDGSYNVTDSGFKTISSDYQQIIDAIDEGSLNDYQTGTPMGKALRTAQQRLNSAKYTNKYVVLFTDGMPGYWENNDDKNCMVANNAYNAANKIKETAVLYTVGYSLSGTLYWKAGHSDSTSENHEEDEHSGTSASNFLEQYIATKAQGSQKYAYTTTDNEGLKKTFENLAGSIGSLYSIDPKQIVDVIDARFKLTEKQKNEFNANPDIKFTENEDGTTTIIWTGSAAHIGNASSTDADNQPWSATIDIVAKDDFIGGNAIPTNTGESGIYIDDTKEKLFDRPTVNVKPLSLDMTGKEITVYKGDQIASSGFYSELAETLKVKQLDNKDTLTAVLPTTSGKVVLPGLTKEQITALNGNRTLTIGTDQSYTYTYPRTSDAVGYFTYTYKISETPGGDAKDHTAGDPGTPAEQYTLEVNFVPYTVDARTAANATIAPTVNGGTAVTEKLTKTADYKVNIIAGAIEITKILEGDQQVSEGTEFSFKVTGPDLFEKIIKLTVTYDEEANRYVATYPGNDADNELKNLARGKYTVTEIETEGYQVKGTPIVGEKTDTWNTKDNEQDTVTFELGYHKANNGEKADVIVNKKYESKDGGVLGQVTYTNEAVYKNWAVIKVSESSKEQKLPDAEFTLTKNGKVECYGKSDANGKVHWFEDSEYSEEVTKIPAGTYELKEVKAPVGYVLTNDTYNLVITKNGALKSVTKGNQEETMEVADGEYKIYIENKVIYDLPSTGHTGIFNILMSGILLMFAGILIIYKMKGKEVLKK
ncbi:MAG: SpaA isopeptide-forming pilin-related protein [Lachnospiraceae bacterium]|nr:SpaA isopeptide-forming pilin-related protein [Lachnospiraceae bacterium]